MMDSECSNYRKVVLDIFKKRARLNKYNPTKKNIDICMLL